MEFDRSWDDDLMRGGHREYPEQIHRQFEHARTVYPAHYDEHKDEEHLYPRH